MVQKIERRQKWDGKRESVEKRNVGFKKERYISTGNKKTVKKIQERPVCGWKAE